MINLLVLPLDFKSFVLNVSGSVFYYTQGLIRPGFTLKSYSEWLQAEIPEARFKPVDS